MEYALETAALFVDNLLDFSDIGEEDDDDGENKKNPLGLDNNQHHNNHNANNNSAESLLPDTDGDHGSFPVLEEELEWLSNENAFPPIETFDILSVKPEIVPKKPDYVTKNQSPVSVLGNSSSSIRIPVKARSKRRRRRRTFSDLSGQQWWFCYEPKKKNVGGMRNSMTTSIVRRCLHCQVDKTPQWRAGPLGPKTLCNACGVRYKSGRLLPEYRPANSPTFSEELHSNSHRKVMDMRKQKQKETFLQPSEMYLLSSDKGKKLHPLKIYPLFFLQTREVAQGRYARV